MEVSGGSRERVELAGDGRFVDVVADADPEAGDERRVGLRRGGDRAPVTSREIAFDGAKEVVADGAGVFDARVVSGELGGDEAVVSLEDLEWLARRVLPQVDKHAGDAFGRDLPAGQAEAEELAGELPGLLGGGHRAGCQSAAISRVAASL